MLKLKEFISKFSSNKNMQTVYVILIIGIVLIIAGNTFFGGKQPGQEAAKSLTSQWKSVSQSELERELVSVLSQIKGVGKVTVMLTLEGSSEKIVATNTKSADTTTSAPDKPSTSKADSEQTVVIIKGRSGDEPILLKEQQPKVRGVLVVCDGADNPQIKLAVYDAAKALLNVAPHRVEVQTKK